MSWLISNRLDVGDRILRREIFPLLITEDKMRRSTRAFPRLACTPGQMFWWKYQPFYIPRRRPLRLLHAAARAIMCARFNSFSYAGRTASASFRAAPFLSDPRHNRARTHTHKTRVSSQQQTSRRRTQGGIIANHSIRLHHG